ncbi:Zn-dependent exopeptidase [Neoconidiobolus thromboides FSU 785]|nr:Zn-dependent exopeptidase [Neoconidiobolus thromboides FSU 785]
MSNRRDNQPLNKNHTGNNYGTSSSSNEDLLNRNGGEPLLSFSRIKRSFAPGQSSVYILSSAIVSFVVVCSLIVIIVLGGSRILHPNPSPHRYIDPFKGFDRVPSTDSLRSHLKYITKDVHIAGKGKPLAEWYAKRLKSFGLKTETVEYYPYLNYPSNRRLAIVDPPELKYEAKLTEERVKEDYTSQDPNAVPTFHGLSASGNVTAEIVYANYGTWDDFKVLEVNNISVKGKIVLVKYGKCFRGLKVRAAELKGAIGVLIYSDPSDDGEKKGDIYPKGPFRPSSGVQRGSVSYLSLLAGDPLTPGVPATKDAVRIPIEEAKVLPKIPSLPISYGDALPLFRALAGEGKRAKKLGPDWEGGLEISYWTGPSEAKVNLVNIVNGGIHTIYNVIATIPGEEEPEKQIIFGNHRDAWVYGATDPGSGSAAMLEVARTFGYLLKRGWKPRRTIKLCSWDGEEYGLIGSTEWSEDFAKELTKEAVAYINVDGFEGTQFSAAGTPTLLKLIENVTAQVNDPYNNGTIYDTWFKNSKGSVQLRGLGSGSDFTPFYQNLGISSVNLDFSSKHGSGIYHSNYDSFHYVEKFSDPEFKTHLAMTQIIGKLLITLADGPLLSFQLGEYGSKLSAYVEKVEESIKKGSKNKVNFTAFRKALTKFTDEGKKVDAEAVSLHKKISNGKGKESCPKDDKECLNQLKWINDKMAFLERKMLDQDGIEGREFYKHFVYAPGLWAGYETQVFPSLNEALDVKDYKKANEVWTFLN